MRTDLFSLLFLVPCSILRSARIHLAKALWSANLGIRSQP